MHTCLRQNLRYVELNSEIIFFDLERDRYFMARGRLAELFSAWLKGAAELEAQQELLSYDILMPCDEWVSPGREHLRPPQSSSLDQPSTRVGMMLTIEAILYQLWAKRLLKRRPLEAIMAKLERRAMACDDAEDELYAAITQAFHQARSLVRFEEQCLSRSVGMMLMLLRRRARAQLVIGVKLPFESHCWVEQELCSLTDPIEALLSFTPIYRMGIR